MWRLAPKKEYYLLAFGEKNNIQYNFMIKIPNMATIKYHHDRFVGIDYPIKKKPRKTRSTDQSCQTIDSSFCQKNDAMNVCQKNDIAIDTMNLCQKNTIETQWDIMDVPLDMSDWVIITPDDYAIVPSIDNLILTPDHLKKKFRSAKIKSEKILNWKTEPISYTKLYIITNIIATWWLKYKPITKIVVNNEIEQAHNMPDHAEKNNNVRNEHNAHLKKDNKNKKDKRNKKHKSHEQDPFLELENFDKKLTKKIKMFMEQEDEEVISIIILTCKITEVLMTLISFIKNTIINLATNDQVPIIKKLIEILETIAIEFRLTHYRYQNYDAILHAIIDALSNFNKALELRSEKMLKYILTGIDDHYIYCYIHPTILHMQNLFKLLIVYSNAQLTCYKKIIVAFPIYKHIIAKIVRENKDLSQQAVHKELKYLGYSQLCNELYNKPDRFKENYYNCIINNPDNSYYLQNLAVLIRDPDLPDKYKNDDGTIIKYPARNADGILLEFDTGLTHDTETDILLQNYYIEYNKKIFMSKETHEELSKENKEPKLAFVHPV